MAIEGVDLDDGRPGGAALAAAGKQFVCRYLDYTGNPDPSKPLSRAEVADYHGHGLSIVANFESLKDRALQGRAAGVMDGRDALAFVTKMGFPDTCPVYFSCDFEATAAEWPAIDEYFAGVATELPLSRIGIYGSYALMVHAKQTRIAIWYWQTYAWSGTQVVSFGHLYQYLNGQTINGEKVDFDHALQDNYGGWAPQGGSVYNFALISPGVVGSLVVAGPGHYYLDLATGKQQGPINPATFGTKDPAYPVKISPPLPGGAPGADRSTGYLIGVNAAFLLKSDVVFTAHEAPATDCSAEIAAATAPLEAQIAAFPAQLTAMHDKTKAAAVAAVEAIP